MLKGLLADAGFKALGDAHIVAVEIGDEKRTSIIARRLLEKNVFVFSARYPTVPPGKAILRIGMTAMHDENDIRFFAKLLKETYDDEFYG